MEYANLGLSGLRVSRICLGMMGYGDASDREWVIDEAQAEPMVRAAVEAGVNFFDTADIYSGGASEVATGRLLRRFIKREEAVVATKGGLATTPGENGGGLGRKHLFDAVDASLGRLEMDYVDLYIIHRWDPRTPIRETMEALHDIVRSGRARHIGASSMYAWQFAKAQAVAREHGWTPFISMQNHMNLVYREEEREMLPLCVDQGVGVTPWSPLARGRLARTGVTTRGTTDDIADAYYGHESDEAVITALQGIAAARGASPASVALAWLMHQPAVVGPVIGASRLGHVEDAVAAVGLALDAAELEQLEAPYRPHAVTGHS